MQPPKLVYLVLSCPLLNDSGKEVQVSRVCYNCLVPDRDSQRPLVLTIHERVNEFSKILEDQVPFGECASGQYLDRVHAAGVVLNDRDHFLIPCGLAQFPQHHFRDAYSHRKSRALMSVKLDGSL